MAITTLDGLIGASKQLIPLHKTTARTTVAGGFFSLFDIAGNPGAGTLAAGNTANGLVPTDTTTGYPRINTASQNLYLNKTDAANSVTCNITLFDRLFVAGAYAYNADTTLASQPSYSGRLPNTDYNGLELWVEQVTAATGNQAVQVNYLDQDGGAGDTGVVGIGAAPTVGRCWQLPLAAGDSGIQQITRVRGSTATAGTFNVMVLRRLARVNVPIVSVGQTLNFIDTGLPQLYDTSALYVLVNATSTSSGLPDLLIGLADG